MGPFSMTNYDALPYPPTGGAFMGAALERALRAGREQLLGQSALDHQLNTQGWADEAANMQHAADSFAWNTIANANLVNGQQLHQQHPLAQPALDFFHIKTTPNPTDPVSPSQNGGDQNPTQAVAPQPPPLPPMQVPRSGMGQALANAIGPVPDNLHAYNYIGDYGQSAFDRALGAAQLPTTGF